MLYVGLQASYCALPSARPYIMEVSRKIVLVRPQFVGYYIYNFSSAARMNFLR